MPDILHLLTIRAEPERVFRALSTEDGVRGWWTRDAVLDAKGAEFSFYGRRVVTKAAVDRMEPPTRLVWKIASSNAPGGWAGTTVAFDLRAQDGGTVLRFAHRGFAQADDGFARVTTGWAYFLVSLQRYVESGAGAPAPDVDFARMLG